jgi:hypothetical protein
MFLFDVIISLLDSFFSGVLQEVVDFDLVVVMEHFQQLKDAYAMVSYRLKHSKEILSPLSPLRFQWF